MRLPPSGHVWRVISAVFGLGHYLQIFWTVIRFYPVLVMDNGSRWGRGDYPMFIYSALKTSSRPDSISFLSDFFLRRHFWIHRGIGNPAAAHGMNLAAT